MFEPCPSCGYVNKSLALRQALEDAKKTFPANISFYDFGDGIITMPMPDIVSGSYLTKSVSFLFTPDPGNPVPEARLGRVLGFSYRIRHGSRGEEIYREVLQAALKAFDSFEEKAVRISEGESLPIPIEV